MTSARAHGFHRHDNARLIVFSGGPYRERTLSGVARLNEGDFIVRPPCHAHDGHGEADAGYAALPCAAEVLRDFFVRHGHLPRTGHIPKGWDGDGNDLLIHAATRPYDALTNEVPMDRAATRLLEPEAPLLSELAEEMGLRPWEFSRAFRAAFGLSPTEYRCEARLQRAIAMIAGSRIRLSQIAAETGFSDQSHFCRELRRRTGHTAGRIARLLDS